MLLNTRLHKKGSAAARCLVAVLVVSCFLRPPTALAQAAPAAVTQAAPAAVTQAAPAAVTQVAPAAVTQAAPGAGAQAAPPTDVQEVPLVRAQVMPSTGALGAPYSGATTGNYAVQTSGAYTIHADDQLQVQVFGTQGLYSTPGQNGQFASNTIQPLSQTVTVLSDGTINYPLIGTVAVAGLRPDDAAHRISDDLLAFVIHPIVSVEVLKGTAERISILGSVEHGGQFELARGDRLVDLLVKAGVGPQSFADLNHITLNRVVDGIPRLYNIDVYNMLLNADYAANPILESGDVVYVPKAKQHNAADFLNLPFALYYLHLLAVPGATGVIP